MAHCETTDKLGCIPFTIFYAWQNDRRRCYTRGLDRIGHGHVGVPGSPAIAESILQKIDACGIFVADATPVSSSAEGGKLVRNPYVMLEIGYVVRSKSLERIVMIMNTAFGSPANLPLDLRQSPMGPLTYSPPTDDSSSRMARLNLRFRAIYHRTMASIPETGYRTVGIDTQIPWPAAERVITFREREFHLLPGSDTLSRMIRVKTEPGFTQVDADKLIFEFLSALAWAEQTNAITTFGNWCTAPCYVGEGPMGIIGSGQFDYLPDPIEPKAKLALAMYREGLSVNVIPYQFLGFFKVINVIRDKGPAQIQWIKDNLQYVTDKDALTRIAAIQAKLPDVPAYLYVSGRCAVAHAFDQTKVVNPDAPADLIRLSEDLPVIRELARVAIEREFGIESKREFYRNRIR